MPTLNRKTTPKVKRGRVQKKNNWKLTPNYWVAPHPDEVVIDRERPGKGYRHLLLQKDVHRFISILPDWQELAIGLDAILLAEGEWNTNGWHKPGVVAICAWDEDMWISHYSYFYDEHRELIERLEVPLEHREKTVLVKWTEAKARAYQLLHILPHELGHHHDRMTTRSKWSTARGEAYAEKYALRYAKIIWDRYLEEFGLP